ncbi:MAG: hypothetical protein ABSH20_01340 [Tepidisphaeraceae bacterium]
MSTAVAESVSVSSSPLPFLLRRLHSLTGILFGSYLVIHLMVNATLIEGVRHPGSPAVFAEQVQKIHSLPFLVAIEWTMIYLPILFHGIYGTWIALAGQPNAVNYPYRSNWYYLLQRLSSIIIVLFMLFHILGFKGVFGPSLAFDPSEAHSVASVERHFQFHWSLLYIVYPLGVLASCFHTANGFRGAAIAWGLTVSKASMTRWNLVCVAIFIAMMACGFTALVAVAGMEPMAGVGGR